MAWNHSFGASTLNELRVGVTRLNFVAVDPQTVVAPSSLGFNINPQDTAGAGVPRIRVRGLFDLGFSSNGPQPRVDTTYQLTDNFSKVVGKHSLKMGFEGRSFMVANPFFGANNGVFGFNTQSEFTTGISGVDFLLGIPATYFQGSGGHIDATAKEFYMYFQDQWRVWNNLTLTPGHRIPDRHSNRPELQQWRVYELLHPGATIEGVSDGSPGPELPWRSALQQAIRRVN